MRIFLITLGSAGDVHPFIGLALRLQQRGHCVTLMTSGYFSDLIERAGVAFEPLGSREEFEKISDNRALWHPRKGFGVMARGIVGYMPRMFEKIESYVRRFPDTVLVGSSLAFGARMVQEKFGTPLVTVHLSPGTIRSVYDMMKLPGAPIHSSSPMWLKRSFFWLADRFALDRLLGPPLNDFRRTIGLEPVSGIVRSWWHSPERVIGLWPEWFAPPQPDWPPQVRLTGFPLWDEQGVTQMEPALLEFLDAGPPPVVFTPGSAMMHGEDFFRNAAAGCELAGVRGIFLTRHLRHLPARLPSKVRHFQYAPFSQLLPRCAALVHHGGIGTTAQALATGTPQIVMPLSFDQFDNADRSERLGAAAVIPLKYFRPKKIAEVIEQMTSPPATDRSRQIAAKFRGHDGLEQACEWIEKTSIEQVQNA